MANPAYMSIEGRVQGLISSGCSTPESVGNRSQLDQMNEIMVLSYSHNMSNFGKRNHNPFVITKGLDKSSPLLAQALSSGEKLTCVLKLYRTTPQGSQENYYTVRLKSAVIVDITSELPHVIDQNDLEAYEMIAFKYGEIEWQHNSAGTSGIDAWKNMVQQYE